MKYTIVVTKQYKKAFKKIKHNRKLVKELELVVDILATDDILDKKYRDHYLSGILKDFRELHVRPNLLLVYRKYEDKLVLILANLGSHNELF